MLQRGLQLYHEKYTEHCDHDHHDYQVDIVNLIKKRLVRGLLIASKGWDFWVDVSLTIVIVLIIVILTMHHDLQDNQDNHQDNNQDNQDYQDFWKDLFVGFL